MNKKGIIKKGCTVAGSLAVVGIIIYYFAIPWIIPIKVKGIFIPYDYVLDGTEVGITRYKGTEEVVKIPNKIMFRDVTKIMCEPQNKYAGTFEGNNFIKKVVMPDTVKIIETEAFSECTNLEEISLSANLEEIQMLAFWSCNSLKSINLPDGLEVISSGVFVLCDSLEKIEIPSTVKEIGDYAFNQCTSLKEVVIPDTISQISGNSFLNTPWYEAQKEDYVVVGDGVLIKYNGIGEVVEIPEGVKYVGYGVFCNIEEKTEYYKEMEQKYLLPKSLEVIGYMTFPSVNSTKTIVVQNDFMDFTEDSIYQSEKDDELTIVAREGSTGQKYAEENGIAWVELED